MKAYPFRLGATSYVIPDDILPNVRYLRGIVQDVELVLFEVDDGPNNLPGTEVVAELRALAETGELSYTVHLPLDLRLDADGDYGHISMVKARKVIERTRDLDPWAYVLHLDGREVRQGASHEALARWQENSVRALQRVADWVGGPEWLAVENLESYPLDFLHPVLDRVPVSRCVDIGHLWLDGHDPLPFLQAALPRTKVIHLHGIADRDHRSLAHASPTRLRAVLETLHRANYSGVVTLEVFEEDDFTSSLTAVEAAWTGD